MKTRKFFQTMSAAVMAAVIAFTGLPYVNTAVFDITASAAYEHANEAKSVKIGEIAKGSLDSTGYMGLSSVSHYYKAEINHSGEVSITKGGKKYRASNVKIRVFDSAGTEIPAYGKERNTQQINAGTFDVKRAGTYYLEVSGRNTDYIFTLSMETGTFVFADEAKPLEIGASAQGHLAGGGLFAYSFDGCEQESNYYKLTLNQSGTLTIISGDKFSNGQFSSVSVYDSLSNGLFRWSHGSAADDIRSVEAKLSKGTYYIALTGSDTDYLFTTRLETPGGVIGKYLFANEAKPLSFGKTINAELPNNGADPNAQIFLLLFANFAVNGGGVAAPATEHYKLEIPSAGEVKISIGGNLVSGELVNPGTALIGFNEYGEILGQKTIKTALDRNLLNSTTINAESGMTLYLALTGPGTEKYKIKADFTAAQIPKDAVNKAVKSLKGSKSLQFTVPKVPKDNKMNLEVGTKYAGKSIKACYYNFKTKKIFLVCSTKADKYGKVTLTGIKQSGRFLLVVL